MTHPIKIPNEILPHTAVRERPILFSGAMIRQILNGAKTQTRRVVKPQSIFEGREAIVRRYPNQDGCPHGRIGDYLWVKEKFSFGAHGPFFEDSQDGTLHIAWISGRSMPRRYSRITLQITEIRVERVQDISEEDAKAEGILAQIGDDGQRGPGFKWSGVGYHGAGFDKYKNPTFHTPARDGKCSCKIGGPGPARCAFRELWDSINGKTFSWKSNPWVWCLSFKVVKP
jgi:hypothetical protein